MTNTVAAMSRDSLQVKDLDLSLFAPKYVLKKAGPELNGSTVVHLRRKHVAVPLFVRPFYLACYSFFLRNDVQPESTFSRTRYKKNVYKYKNGKLVRNTNQSTDVNQYLSMYSQENTYKGKRDIYHFVTARFIDPSRPNLNLGFTITAGAINVKMYLTREMERKVAKEPGFDYVNLFESFLFTIGYPESVYVANAEHKTVYRLYALQNDVRQLMMKNEW